jgi:outer membrane receptor for ferrienterochelin and colicins
MIRIIITCVFYFVFVKAYAQVVISGKVQNNGSPIANAVIQVIPTGATVYSQTDGTYKIEKLAAGSYTLQVSAPNYRTKKIEVEVIIGKLLTLDLDLDEDNLQIDQVVVTGTRNQISLYKSPVIVSSIGKRTFENTQSLSLSEGLSFTPGLRLENNCQNCGFTQLRMNGLDGPYTQILINSRPIFSALAGVYGLEMIPANMIDRIEVVRGGGSVLYGGNAIAGTLNVITRDPSKNAFELSYNQSLINMNTPEQTATINGSIVSEDATKGVSLYAFNRSRQYWDANGDGFSEITQLQNTTAGFDAFWNLDKRSKLKLGGYVIDEFRRGGSNFDREPHQSEVAEQLQHQIRAINTSYERYSKNYKRKLSVYSSAQFITRNSYYGGGGRMIAPGDSITSDDLLAINAYGRSNDVALVNGVQFAWELSKKWMLTTGSEIQYNNTQDRMPGYDRTISQQVSTTGNYLQLEYKPISRLTILAGGRFDYVWIRGDYQFGTDTFLNRKNIPVAIPRLSMMYDMTDAWKFRVSYAQGYRTPQAYDEDLHIETVGGAARFIQIDPSLKTETSNSFLASFNYNKSIGKRQVSFLVEGFYTQLQNPFILSNQTELPNGVAVITKRNGDGAAVQGVNIEFNYAWSRNLILQMGATLQQAFYMEEEEIWAPEDSADIGLPTTTTQNLLRTPNVYGYATITWKPTTRSTLSYSGVYTGAMDVAHVINPENEQTVIKRTPVFFEHNIRFAYDVMAKENYKLQCFAGMQNIFNAYQRDFDSGPQRDAGYVYGPIRPRTAFFGIKFVFN